jgi:hypothetical protein
MPRPQTGLQANGAPPPLYLDLELRYLVQRPRSRGVRNVGTPFGVPSVWWKPEGAGGFVSLGVPLPELVEGIQGHSDLDAQQRQRWRSAAVESTLDPDVFPRLYPRVWLRSTPSQASSPANEALVEARARLRWSVEAVGKEAHRLEILQSTPELELELALPLRWRGQILADWHCDWPGAQSRKVLGPQREWRVVRAPPQEGTLELRYRLAQGAVRWR